MKINKKLYIQLLEEELVYERSERSIALADLKREQRIGEEYEKENAQLLFKNNDLNDDFFRLGDIFMASGKSITDILEPRLKQMGPGFVVNLYQHQRIDYLEDLIFELGDEIQRKEPEQKLKNEFANLDDFILSQHEKRVEYLEEIIFDFGDEIQEYRCALEKNEKTMKVIISSEAEKVISLKRDIQDIQAEWAKEASEWKLAGKARLSELDEHRRTIRELKEEIEKKARVTQEAIYADKKCKYDLEQKISVLEKENKELKVALAKFKEEAFEDDREQIAGEIEKAEQSAPKKKSSTTGENTPKTKAKSIGENTITILGIKNKLCNKGYEVQDTGKSLLAKKPGNRHIEVKHAELPGSFKYIICGQTCYEFDQALKASAYGAKAIAPKLDAEAIS